MVKRPTNFGCPGGPSHPYLKQSKIAYRTQLLIAYLYKCYCMFSPALESILKDVSRESFVSAELAIEAERLAAQATRDHVAQLRKAMDGGEEVVTSVYAY